MTDYLVSDIAEAEGLPEKERIKLRELLDIYRFHLEKNEKKDRYYEGHIYLGDVNLGIALPEGFKKLEIGCAWGEKTVDVLAARSMFDGFVGMNGENAEAVKKIVDDNKLISEYKKACKDELKYGVTFATLGKAENGGCKIRFHTPETSAAKWNGDKMRIDCGFAIIDTIPDESVSTHTPTLINYHTDDCVWVLEKMYSSWVATPHPHKMGRPLMEPLVWNATTKKPFGRSRIKEPIRRLIESFVRTIANATIGLEFSTTPQKYLLGVTDAQYDALVNEKFRQYVGAILAGTTNPETGEKPSVGQFAQGSLQPHVEMLRMISTQFSAATGLTVSDTGVVNDANPTSSDAILAQSKTLTQYAEELNSGNADTLKEIAKMALAITHNVKLEDVPEEEANVMPHFKNPAMPSISVTADAALKIASARPNFSKTDVFLEMVGFDQADIRRIRAQETRAEGASILLEEFAENDDNE
jgi:hypothetical protein